MAASGGVVAIGARSAGFRELTRVATPVTEEAFLRKAQGKTAHQVQQMIAGLKYGDEPDAQPDPALITKRVVMSVSVETYAMWRRMRTALDEEFGERLSDNDLAQTVCQRATEKPRTPDEVPRPAVQTAITTCRVCKTSRAKLARSIRPPSHGSRAMPNISGISKPTTSLA